MKLITKRTFNMPNFCAIVPRTETQSATIPQQKPFINPATILLYSGSVFCAQTITIGCASIVVNPINVNVKRDIIGFYEFERYKKYNDINYMIEEALNEMLKQVEEYNKIYPNSL